MYTTPIFCNTIGCRLFGRKLQQAFCDACLTTHPTQRLPPAGRSRESQKERELTSVPMLSTHEYILWHGSCRCSTVALCARCLCLTLSCMALSPPATTQLHESTVFSATVVSVLRPCEGCPPRRLPARRQGATARTSAAAHVANGRDGLHPLRGPQVRGRAKQDRPCACRRRRSSPASGCLSTRCVQSVWCSLLLHGTRTALVLVGRLAPAVHTQRCSGGVHVCHQRDGFAIRAGSQL